MKKYLTRDDISNLELGNWCWWETNEPTKGILVKVPISPDHNFLQHYWVGDGSGGQDNRYTPSGWVSMLPSSIKPKFDVEPFIKKAQKLFPDLHIVGSIDPASKRIIRMQLV